MATPGSLWIGEQVDVGLPPADCVGISAGTEIEALFCRTSDLFSSHPPNPLSSRTFRFVVYKLPAHSGSGDTPWKGLTYKYMDQNSEGWQDGAGYINSSKGAVGLSLQPLYRKNSSQVT